MTEIVKDIEKEMVQSSCLEQWTILKGFAISSDVYILLMHGMWITFFPIENDKVLADCIKIYYVKEAKHVTDVRPKYAVELMRLNFYILFVSQWHGDYEVDTQKH